MASDKTSNSSVPPESVSGKMLIYKDAGLNLQVRLDGETVWLTQAQIAELFQTTPQNVTLHIAAIYDEGELVQEATCKNYLQVQTEGNRQVRRSLKHYSLDIILAVGYRVRSPRGTHRPICSTEFLVMVPRSARWREYLYGLFQSKAFLRELLGLGACRG